MKTYPSPPTPYVILGGTPLTPRLTVGVGSEARERTSLGDEHVFQPPKEEKVEDKEQLGLTTLFPGQKRRISHLTKQGKEVRVCTGVLGGGWQDPSKRLSCLQNKVNGFLCQTQFNVPCVLAEKCLGPTSSLSCAPCCGEQGPEQGERDAGEPSHTVTVPGPCLAPSCTV